MILWHCNSLGGVERSVHGPLVVLNFSTPCMVNGITSSLNRVIRTSIMLCSAGVGGCVKGSVCASGGVDYRWCGCLSKSARFAGGLVCQRYGCLNRSDVSIVSLDYRRHGGLEKSTRFTDRLDNQRHICL